VIRLNKDKKFTKEEAEQISDLVLNNIIKRDKGVV